MNPVLTEITTGATDAVLGVLAVVCMAGVVGFRARHAFLASLWLTAFGLLAMASFIGAIVHGVNLDANLKVLLWQPLYLSLGLMLGLIAVAAVSDGWGVAAGRRSLPIALGVGLAFYGITVVADGVFLVFVAYEAAALFFALGVYIGRARDGAPGAALLAAGILVTLVAAAVQQSNLSITIVWPFDHNGIFHLIQIPGLLLMLAGVRRRLASHQA